MKKGDERRKLILNTAEELFCTRGFDDTSVNDVLEITNLSKGGFYHYFDSKDALLLAVCESHVVQSYERCIETLESVPSSAERLETVLKCAMLLRNEDWPFMRVMLPRVRLAGDATLASLMRCIMVTYSELLQKEIERAEAKGDILTPVVGHAHQLIALVLLCLNQIAEDVLSGNGVPAPTGSSLTKANVAWCVASGITTEMEDVVPVLVTRNADVSVLNGELSSGTHDMSTKTTEIPLTAEPAPFGNKAMIVIHKGGAANVVKAKYAKLYLVFNKQSFTIPEGINVELLKP